MGSPYGELVARARAGDEGAFRVLYEQHVQFVYSLTRQLLPDDDAAMDATQDVFVKAWRNLPRLRDSEAFGGWLRVIATNVAHDYGRRRRPERVNSDTDRDPLNEDAPDPGAQAVDSLIADEERRRVREAVLRLPQPQRLVVAMHHFGGMPVADIAAALGVPLGTVLSRLARGRDTLRRMLSPHLGAGE